MRTIEQMIHQEVLCCMSSIVSTLAQGGHAILTSQVRCHDMQDLQNLADQAVELAIPIPDYEDAAREKGWSEFQAQGAMICRDATIEEREGDDSGPLTYASSWEEACDVDRIEPYDREVFEHWAVTNWLADKLEDQGEKVDRDFGGLCIWARTTTGQMIAADSVIERIYAALCK